ncbi:MAG: hypothetical protein V1928_01010 [Parcubacteria group bacterium]
MPAESKKWKCKHCGDVYDEREEAIECEKSHDELFKLIKRLPGKRLLNFWVVNGEGFEDCVGVINKVELKFNEHRNSTSYNPDYCNLEIFGEVFGDQKTFNVDDGSRSLDGFFLEGGEDYIVEALNDFLNGEALKDDNEKGKGACIQIFTAKQEKEILKNLDVAVERLEKVRKRLRNQHVVQRLSKCSWKPVDLMSREE